MFYFIISKCHIFISPPCSKAGLGFSNGTSGPCPAPGRKPLSPQNTLPNKSIFIENTLGHARSFMLTLLFMLGALTHTLLVRKSLKMMVVLGTFNSNGQYHQKVFCYSRSSKTHKRRCKVSKILIFTWNLKFA